MIVDDYEWTEGDTGPCTTTTLLDANGDPVNLVNVQEFKFYMNTWPGNATKIDGSNATILIAGGGEVTYDRALADVDTPGEYRAQYYVKFADNTEQWFPTNKIRVTIRSNLDVTP